LLTRDGGRAPDERWHLCKDGSQFWASGEMMPLKSEDGALVGFPKILRDRTERREADAALEASELRYRSLVEVSPKSSGSPTRRGTSPAATLTGPTIPACPRRDRRAELDERHPVRAPGPDAGRLARGSQNGTTIGAPPRGRGFGSRLIERSFAAEVGGEVELIFATSGLICRLEAPLASMHAAQGQAVASCAASRPAISTGSSVTEGTLKARGSDCPQLAVRLRHSRPPGARVEADQKPPACFRATKTKMQIGSNRRHADL
jgi:PAS domain-containing protein